MLLLVTPGDPEGIGPEIVFRTLNRSRALLPRKTTVLCVGARKPFERLGAKVIEVQAEEILQRRLPRPRAGEILLLPAPTSRPKPPRARRGSAFSLPGFQSGWSIETATRFLLSGHADALVTGPISKERLQAGGYPFPGHTEFLAELCGEPEVTMMLANEQLRISLVTTHLAMKDVPRAITAREILRTIDHTVTSLRTWWAIDRPRIAVCALNPHAGENGLFGKEEIQVISPALKKARDRYRDRAEILGPFPSDTLFAKNQQLPAGERYDAVICMYHDQGLIPVKLLDFPNTVNITLGLPIVRTSVDHGVAFDLVGTGKADPSSFESALKLAYQISTNRKEPRS